MKVFISLICAILSVGCAIISPVRADAPEVAPDGAVSANIAWEQHTASQWYIELQRLGAEDIIIGIAREDDSLIRQGILIVRWGFAHQSADGSFTGTGDPFHSAAIFVEDVADATLQLSGYRPLTYSADDAFYSAVVAEFSTSLHASAMWFTTPAVASAGQASDQPFTHRRYLLGALLAEIGALTHDNSLYAAAVPYIHDGLAQQLTVGTVDVPYPDGSVKTVSLAGVNPERGGFDVSYQCTSVMFAIHFYRYCPDAALRKAIRAMISPALLWVSRRISTTGVLDETGSTRAGHEINRDGTPKHVDAQEVISGLVGGYQITANRRYWISANRYVLGSLSITPDAVAPSGAVSGNATWEQQHTGTWSISSQRIGADYIEAGITQENDALIRKGVTILQWGFAQQLPDGSFGSTSSPYYGSAQFVEAATRAAADLQNFSPAIYRADIAYYSSVAAAFAQNSCRAASWLTSISIWPQTKSSVAAYTSRQFTLAAALSACAQISGDDNLRSYADEAALAGLNMQVPDGMDPENGVSSVSGQAAGLICLQRYLVTSPGSPHAAFDTTALSNGLLWELEAIHTDGTVTGTSSSGVKKQIDQAYALGSELLNDPRLIVARERLNQPVMKLAH